MLSGGLKPWHILVVIVAFVVLFGWKKLPDISRSIGRSARILKSEVDEMKAEHNGQSSSAAGQTVPGETASNGKPQFHENLQQGFSAFREGYSSEQPAQTPPQGSQQHAQPGYQQQPYPQQQQQPYPQQQQQPYPQQPAPGTGNEPAQGEQPQAGYPQGYPRRDTGQN